MANFPLPNTAYAYRPLKRATPPLAGWDVYALQTALEVPRDGAYGVVTEGAVLEFQQRRFTDTDEHDGIAGIGTQRELMKVIARKATKTWDLPKGCPYGHCEKESGGILGNHSSRYPNGSWDVGLTQRNTQFIDGLEDGFDVHDSVHELCKRVAANWGKYSDLGKVSRRRAFELACGSWNAPAWTGTLAHGGTLTPSQLSWIEAYISRVTSYCDLEDL